MFITAWALLGLPFAKGCTVLVLEVLLQETACSLMQNNVFTRLAVQLKSRVHKICIIISKIFMYIGDSFWGAFHMQRSKNKKNPFKVTKTCRITSSAKVREELWKSETSDSWYFLLKWALIAALCAFFWAFTVSRSFLQTQQTETQIHLTCCRQEVIRAMFLPQHRWLEFTSWVS